MSTHLKQWRNAMKTTFEVDDPATTDAEADGLRLTEMEVYTYIETILSGEEPIVVIPNIYHTLMQNPEELARVEEILATFQTPSAEMPSFQNEARYNLDFLPRLYWQLPPIPIQIQELFEEGKRWIQEQDAYWIDIPSLFGDSLQPTFSTGQRRSKRGESLASKKEIIKEYATVEEDLDLDVKAYANEDPETCTLVIRAILTKLWPQKDSLFVHLMYGKTSMKQTTNDEDEVVFDAFPRNALDSLIIKVDSNDG